MKATTARATLSGAAVPADVVPSGRPARAGIITPGIAAPGTSSRPPAENELTTGTQRAGIAALQIDGADSSFLAQRLRDYVTLTKPRIISLLLVTTVAPMVVAAGGWPGANLILWTMVGGYLMAGGANAVNMYIDRDIDAVMTRTALRPIPSGRMSPLHVLGFGVTLAIAAFLLLAVLVNPLAAGLAFIGFLYYVFIYTRWLKRRTPQNIVIGGGAGAFPPLVGWAAVTGSLSITAVLFFLIVVLWTPPHFWALALVKEKEYGRVSVPMAPNVWGADNTIHLMRSYAIALVIATVAPLPFGALGFAYGTLAIGLGVWLLRDIESLRDARERIAPAWRVYKTSLLYLALLFLAMVVDVAIRGAPL